MTAVERVVRGIEMLMLDVGPKRVEQVDDPFAMLGADRDRLAKAEAIRFKHAGLGAAALGLPSEPRALTDWAVRTAPWRSYLTAHLWRAVPPRPAPRRRAATNLTVDSETKVTS